MKHLNIISQPFLVKLYDQRTTLYINLINLKQRYSDNDPQVFLVQKEIQTIDKKLKEEVDKIVFLMESSLAKLKTDEKSLLSALAEIEKKAEDLPEKGEIINRLKRKIGNEAIVLSNLVQKGNQELIKKSRDNRLENVKLITPPTYYREKVSPKRGMIIFISAFLGLMASLGLALCLEYFDQSFGTEDDITDSLGLPVLAATPDIEIHPNTGST